MSFCINLKFAICILQFACIAIPLAVISMPANGDEGMWLFNSPPNKILKERYNFTATPEWLKHVQLASVRFNAGGSASFVSGDGLVMTNHHVGADALQKFGSSEHDYLKDGFYAKTRDEELKCADQELNVLVSIEDVTARVNAAVPPGADMAAAEKARRAVMNTIEKESMDQTGLRSDVITLYHGGEYQLYRYKKYTDVRLVFAPEQDAAFFGGDPDNFEYPRYDLDICFFRVYEDGKPAKIDNYLKWSPAGPERQRTGFRLGQSRANRPAGHNCSPGVYPRPCHAILAQYGFTGARCCLRSTANGVRKTRAAPRTNYFTVQNSRKARLGMLAGLQDPAVMDPHKAAEQAFRQAVMKDPQLEKSCGDAWNTVAESLKVWEPIYKDFDLLEKGSAFDCRLFKIARTLVRLAEETAKPNAERLREYRESNLDSLKAGTVRRYAHIQGFGNASTRRFAELFYRNRGLRQ